MSIDLDELSSSFARLRCIAATSDASGLGRVELEHLLIDAAKVAGLAESVRLVATGALERIANATGTLDPEQVVGAAGRTSRRDAAQTVRRARVSGEIPALGAALAEGLVSATHLDAVANAFDRVEPGDRDRLLQNSDWICGVAIRSTPEELARAVAKRARQLSADDGVARFERQRRATTLRHWTDLSSGMVCLHGEFDPESGAMLISGLAAAADRLFRTTAPDSCPDDDRRHGHLRAHALLALVRGGRAPTGAYGTAPRPEILVVIDHATLRDGVHATSRVEVTGGVELPIETLRRYACLADIIPVVLDAAGVAIDVGRSQRLATVGQRRALRAMYSHCSVPGCSVAFDHCQLHHIRYWRNGGRSDLANMVPLCSKHHHLVHEGGWALSLRPDDRVLTVTLPDGTTRANPPPLARAG